MTLEVLAFCLWEGFLLGMASLAVGCYIDQTCGDLMAGSLDGRVTVK